MRLVARVSTNIVETSVRNKCRARFIVHFLHYMFRPLLVAIFKWFVIQKFNTVTDFEFLYYKSPEDGHQ
jgi:hypothetical protein